MVQSTTSFEQLNFKEASQKLEELVRALESGDLELEEAMSAYEEGIHLLCELKKRLNAAELKVEELSKTLDEEALAEVDTLSAPSTVFDEER